MLHDVGETLPIRSQDGTDITATSQNNAIQKQRSVGSIRTKHAKNAMYINIGFSIAIFFALVQIFDPTVRNHVENDVLHHHLNHNPILQSLQEFSIDKKQVNHHPHQQTNSKSNLNPTLYNELQPNLKAHDRIISLLEDAGITNTISDIQRQQIPRWDQVVDLYGDNVVIVGKEDCEAYRQQVPLAQRQLGVAGMFNTGTNLLEAQLRKNVHLPKESLWQVPWGKHRMADVKMKHTAADMEQYNKTNILPIVMIRDPFAWLQSMCASPYAASWRHHKNHCPNLVPDESDRKMFKNVNKAFQVNVVFDKQSQRQFDSLVHLWSEWYNQYLHVDYPILIIRFEDLIFQPATVLQEIADCVEGTVHFPIQYQLKSSKDHGSGTDYVKALIKTADSVSRSRNMTVDDLDYAYQHLDKRLMKTFHYHIPK